MSSLSFQQKTLSEAEFKKIAAYIEKNVGIKMPPEKRLMMQSRLSSRLKALHLDSYKQYIDYVFSGKDKDNHEIIMMIDAMTTNLTEFFREPQHFDFMKGTVLPQYAAQGRNQIKIWSAGCSTGQEPYTLSMVMASYIKNNPLSSIRDYSVLATDISTKVLDKAASAIYPMDAVKGIPKEIMHQYFLKGKDPANPAVRLKQDIRSHVNFIPKYVLCSYIKAISDGTECYYMRCIFTKRFSQQFDMCIKRAIITVVIKSPHFGYNFFTRKCDIFVF